MNLAPALVTRLAVAIALPVALGGAGLTFHFVWYQRNGINPLRATPRRRYYQLRGWTWPE